MKKTGNMNNIGLVVDITMTNRYNQPPKSCRKVGFFVMNDYI